MHLSVETRRELRGRCWRWILRHSDEFATSGSARILLREVQGDLAAAWKSAGISAHELAKVSALDISGCSTLTDLRPLRQLRGLKRLNLEGCSNVRDLSQLSALHHLSNLTLGASADLQPLAKLVNLSVIHLHFEPDPPIDLTPLTGLEKLDHICIARRHFGKFSIADEVSQSFEKIKSNGIRSILNRIAWIRRIKAEGEAVLSVLNRAPGISLAEVAAKLSGFTKTDTRRILSRLRQQGLVKRTVQGSSEQWHIVDQNSGAHHGESAM